MDLQRTLGKSQVPLYDSVLCWISFAKRLDIIGTVLAILTGVKALF